MKFDFKNILLGIMIGILGTLIIGCLLNDVYIDIQIGDTTDLEELTGWEKKISIEKTLKDLLNYWVKKIG